MNEPQSPNPDSKARSSLTGQVTAPATAGRTSGWDRRSWHRQASRPVLVWLLLLVVTGLAHPVIPEYRWVLIHLFALGAVTNSIVLWSQYFTEKFLNQRLSDAARPWQLHRIRILNLGIVVTLLGQLLQGTWGQAWIITQIGAGIIALILSWHAFSLARQYFRAAKGRRFRSVVIAYILSALSLPVGAVFGAILAMGPGTGWQEGLLLGHLVVNILGFLGFAAVGSLAVLFPAIWRTRAGTDRTTLAVMLLTVGLVLTTAGALLDQGLIAGVGLLIYVAGWVGAALPWAGNVIAVCRDPRDRLSFAALSVAAAPLWLIGSLIHLAVSVLRAGENLGAVALPTNALLVGFAAQLLLGVMSHLLPSTIGGGSGPLRAGMTELNRVALFRTTLINGGLAIWLASDYSWLKVVMSVLSIGALAAFLPLLIRGVRAQSGVLRGTRQAPPRPDRPRPPLNQITAGISVLALVVALFGGLNGPGAAVAPAPGTGDENVIEVDVIAGDMVFEPAVVEVPAGNQLIINLRNADTLAHDLQLANGVRSGRLVPDQEIRVDAGVIEADVAGWCSIAGHHAQGMSFDVVVVAAEEPADPPADSAGSPALTGALQLRP